MLYPLLVGISPYGCIFALIGKRKVRTLAFLNRAWDNILPKDSMEKTHRFILLACNTDLGMHTPLCGCSRGDRVAVVGANGCGKSTLLNLLAGKDAPNAGTTQLRKGLSVSFMSQVRSLRDIQGTLTQGTRSARWGESLAASRTQTATMVSKPTQSCQ